MQCPSQNLTVTLHSVSQMSLEILSDRLHLVQANLSSQVFIKHCQIIKYSTRNYHIMIVFKSTSMKFSYYASSHVFRILNLEVYVCASPLICLC